ncbi:MAG: DUF1573 domain-containing protein, partial [Bacteroidales bacterium]|jgi:hypothetical protein|nr:DUF1573 domain-containing protein [Bacteroidales bacterium]
MKTIITTLLLFTTVICSGQIKTAHITFNETVHNFGQFPELGGPVSFNFILKNTGEKPFLINDVKTSCSCTISQWSNAPILPGDSTKIETSYDPLRRPAYFKKYIKIYTTIKNEPYTLYITGEVLPHPKTIEEKYPIAVEGIRLSTTQINLGTIDSDKEYHQEIGIINTSEETVHISFKKASSIIETSCTPSTLLPNETGVINIKYNTLKKNDWGWCYDAIPFNINDVANNNYRIKIRANIIDQFDDWSAEQLANAAVMSVDNRNYQFGESQVNAKVNCPFRITNTGKSDLIIHKIKHACSCTTDQLGTYRIAPQESITLPVIFDTKGTKGKQRKTITLYTNAPQQNTFKINVQGNVKAEK